MDRVCNVQRSQGYRLSDSSEPQGRSTLRWPIQPTVLPAGACTHCMPWNLDAARAFTPCTSHACTHYLPAHTACIHVPAHTACLHTPHAFTCLHTLPLRGPRLGRGSPATLRADAKMWLRYASVQVCNTAREAGVRNRLYLYSAAVACTKPAKEELSRARRRGATRGSGTLDSPGKTKHASCTVRAAHKCTHRE